MSEENMQKVKTVDLNLLKQNKLELGRDKEFLPELEADYLVKEMDLNAREVYDSHVTDEGEIIKDDKGNIVTVKIRNQKAILLFHTSILADGTPLFKTFEQCKNMLNNHIRPSSVEKIWLKASALNGLSGEAIEDAGKKSDDSKETPNTDSSEN